MSLTLKSRTRPDKKDEKTRAFHLYELGKRFNNSLTPNYYTMVETNTEFYLGNQWVHLPQTAAMSRLPKPIFNIIKRNTSVLISQIASGGISVNLEPLSYYDGGAGDPSGVNATEFAQAELTNLIEKLKIDYKVRRALLIGAQTGDYCAHFYWDPEALPYGGASGAYRGEICMELVDTGYVMFGNPNNPDAQSQPYILIAGRDTVDNLQREYLSHHPGDEDGARRIQRDSENQSTGAAGKVELDSCETAKCLYVYLYEKVVTEEEMMGPDGNPVMETVTDDDGNPKYEKKDDGSYMLDSMGQPVEKKQKVKQLVTHVHVTKCTRTQTIYEDIDTGLECYPIAWGNWEQTMNCYHGRALVTGIINNQIFINRMFSMVMRHLEQEAFSKVVYNADLIGTWNNQIGTAIGVHGLQPGQGINQVATNLNPPDMSTQILGTIDKVVTLTRECMGVTDIQLGNAKNENTSAIMVMQQNAEVPLENIRAGMYEWIEDIVRILLDMMGTYYGERPIAMGRNMEVPIMNGTSGVPTMDQYTGLMKTTTENRRVMQMYDFNKLKNLYLNIRVDVGTSTAYSEIAMTQTLDNLREAQMIDMVDYLERIPDKLVPRKEELLEKIKMQQQKVDGVQAGQAIPDTSTQQLTEPIQKQMNQNAGSSGKKKGSSQMFGTATDKDHVMNSLPSNVQQQFNSLPTKAKNALARSASMKATT